MSTKALMLIARNEFDRYGRVLADTAMLLARQGVIVHRLEDQWSRGQ